jgi:hypothetical protein
VGEAIPFDDVQSKKGSPDNAKNDQNDQEQSEEIEVSEEAEDNDGMYVVRNKAT